MSAHAYQKLTSRLALQAVACRRQAFPHISMAGFRHRPACCRRGDRPCRCHRASDRRQVLCPDAVQAFLDTIMPDNHTR